MEWSRSGYGRDLDGAEFEGLRRELAEAKETVNAPLSVSNVTRSCFCFSQVNKRRIECEQSRAEVDCCQEGLRTLRR